MSGEPQSAGAEGEGRALLLAPEPPRHHPWNRFVHWGAFALMAVGTLIVLNSLWRHAESGDRQGWARLDPDLLPVLAGFLLLVLAGTVFALRPEEAEARKLILTSVVWTAALFGALVLCWAEIVGSTAQRQWAGTPVSSVASRDAYLAQTIPGWKPSSPKPFRIPTGIMIQSVEFLNANNVQVSGFVWQKYGPSTPPNLEKGVVFPEAVREAYAQEQVYDVVDGGVETIGWYFAATFRQKFDYGRYPFDRQNVWIRMWSRDFARGALLVPDFTSYFTLTPTELPGIEQQFVYSGWTPIYSGFSYNLIAYDTSFGLPRAAQRGEFPELYFDLVLKRSFLGPFTDYFIFGIAAALLLFAILLLTTSNEDLRTRFGLSTAGVVGSVSGLFFAVILKHNQIRTSLGAPATTYSEAVPYILYVLLVLVAVNAVLLASPINIPAVEYRHNLLPKLLYWPTLLGLLLVITFFTFFR